MDNPFDTFVAPVSEDALKKMVALGEQLSYLENQKIELELELAQANARINAIKTNELPAMLKNIGMPRFFLDDGSEIKLKQVVAGSLPKDPEKKAKALDWLDKNDCGDLIKTFVELDFGKGQDNMAKNAIALLKENEYEPVVEKGVHAQSLCARVRERLSKGEDLDLDILNVYVGNVAEYKKAKTK